MSDEMEIIDLGWFWRPLRAIMAKRCEIWPKLLLITMLFQTKWKSSTLDDLEGHWPSLRSSILATAGFLFYMRPPDKSKPRCLREGWTDDYDGGLFG